LNHYAAPEFWDHYNRLPAAVGRLADRSFAKLKNDSRHPSLHLKQIGKYWSVRVGLHYRAVGIGVADGISWFWIGNHPEYDLLFRSRLREEEHPAYA
jgi:hypothetical protein